VKGEKKRKERTYGLEKKKGKTRHGGGSKGNKKRGQEGRRGAGGGAKMVKSTSKTRMGETNLGKNWVAKPESHPEKWGS